MCSEADLSSQRAVLHFLWAKDPIQRIFVKKRFLFAMGNVRRVKRFTAGSRNSLKDVLKSQMKPNQVRTWLRRESKDLRDAGFHALVKPWEKYAKVGEGFVEK
jgi:hypothetical protein